MLAAMALADGTAINASASTASGTAACGYVSAGITAGISAPGGDCANGAMRCAVSAASWGESMISFADCTVLALQALQALMLQSGSLAARYAYVIGTLLQRCHDTLKRQPSEPLAEAGGDGVAAAPVAPLAPAVATAALAAAAALVQANPNAHGRFLGPLQSIVRESFAASSSSGVGDGGNRHDGIAAAGAEGAAMVLRAAAVHFALIVMKVNLRTLVLLLVNARECAHSVGC